MEIPESKVDGLVSELKGRKRSVLLTVILVALIVTVSWSGVLDRGSSDYVDQALTRSVVAFAAARGLNAVVSVFQSTEFSFSVLGGVSVTAGEILDPLNDLVEQYSALMKLSIGSLLIQKVLLEIVSHTFFKIAVTVTGAGLVASLLASSSRFIPFAAKSFVFVVFVRFALLIVFFLNSIVSSVFIENQTRADVQHLTALSSEVNEAIEISEQEQQNRSNAAVELIGLRETRVQLLNGQQALVEPLRVANETLAEAETNLIRVRNGIGLFDWLLRDNPEYNAAAQIRDAAREEQQRIQREYDAITTSINRNQRDIATRENTSVGLPNTIAERAQAQWNGFASAMDPRALKARLEGSVTNIIRVMSLFVFETLILPLMFLYLLSKGMGAIWGIDLRSFISNSDRQIKAQPTPSSS
jgi:hypothetical protein